jgi:hypothetical protein
MRGTLSKSGGGSKRRVGAVVRETAKGAAAAKSQKIVGVTIVTGQTAAGRKPFCVAGPAPSTTALAATAVGRKRTGEEVGAKEEGNKVRRMRASLKKKAVEEEAVEKVVAAAAAAAMKKAAAVAAVVVPSISAAAAGVGVAVGEERGAAAE